MSSDSPPDIVFTIGDVFPAGDPVARWLIRLGMMINDTLIALKHAVGDNISAPERFYFLRLTALHLWAADEFIAHAKKRYPDVTRFCSKLPSEAQDQAQRFDTSIAAIRAPLERMRHNFAHYPEMLVPEAEEHDVVWQALEQLKARTGEIVQAQELADSRIGVADDVSEAIVLAAAGAVADADHAALAAEIVTHLREAAIALQDWVYACFKTFLEELPEGTLEPRPK